MKPGCYWYWINDNISLEGITKDLEAMARFGLGRAYIGHIFRGGATQAGDRPFGTEAWWEAKQWAVKEADRVGIEIGFFNGPGWSQSGGPWIEPAQSMRFLDASETLIEGGRRIEQHLPVPEITTYPVIGGGRPTRTGPNFGPETFQDVGVIAFRQPATEADDIDMSTVSFSSETITSLTEEFTLTHEPQRIDFDFGGESGVQSFSITPHQHNSILTCVIEASEDGETYHKLERYVEERGHQGPRNRDPILVPFPKTDAPHIRVTLSAQPRDGVVYSNMAFSRRGVLAHYARRQLGEVCPSTTPQWDAYKWPEQAAPAESSAVNSTEVIILNDKMDADGHLVWDAPEGTWVVKRLGMVPLGTQNLPASSESRGLEVCKMSREHIRSHFVDGMVGEFFRRTPEEDRRALKFVIADSYETGPQNWTDDMLAVFEAHYGYSPLRFMPALRGRVVDSPERTNRFMWDWRRLVAERIATEYVGGLRDVAHEHGVTIWLENFGHWGFPSEFLFYGKMSDAVGGEFWERPDSRGVVETRAASSAANIYGHDRAWAEAYTSTRNFHQSPASMKPLTDLSYSSGMNQFILHLYTHQPHEKKPGIIQWFGTDFHRHSTWFEPGSAFVDYLQRCSVLLTSGRPVADVAYYIGESTPVMTGVFEPALPPGYDFDFVNSDVLINYAQVVDGRIVLDSGVCYGVLVLPPKEEMRPAVAAAIQRLVRDGATIIGPRPTSSPSLAGYPESDAEVRAIGAEVWGNVDGETVTTGRYGKGRVYQGVTLEDVLADIALEPALHIDTDGAFRYAVAGTGHNRIGRGQHGGIVFKQRASDDHEVFFIANTGNDPLEFTASLRVSERQPELWNAVTGEIRPAAAFQQEGGRTLLPLSLAPAECVYVVFRQPIGPEVAGTAESNVIPTDLAANLAGPWTVRFDGFGAPEETTFESLIDWKDHDDDAIRHYSGTAVYKTQFELTTEQAGSYTVLSLGEVQIMGKVIVNGEEAGTAWTTPWEVNITDHVRPGANTLKIEVTNTWHNRLVADRNLPPEERQTWLSEWGGVRSDRLLPAGLLGPVEVRVAQ